MLSLPKKCLRVVIISAVVLAATMTAFWQGTQVTIFDSRFPPRDPILAELVARGAVIRAHGTTPTAISFAIDAKSDRGDPKVNKLTIEDARTLALYRSLEVLDLYHTSVDDEFLKALLPLRNLRVLDLGWDKITSDGCKELVRFERLEELDIRGNDIGDDGIRSIAKCVHLKKLGVAFTHSNDATLQIIGNIKQLTWLDISGNERITDHGMVELKQPGLKRLMIKRNGTHGTTLGLLPCRDSLEYLYATSSDFDDQGAAAMRGYRRLLLLDLSNSRITDAALIDISTLTTLKALILKGADITDRGLVKLKSLQHLSCIELFGSRVTDNGIKELLNEIPGAGLGIEPPSIILPNQAFEN